jgi:hypothetical protein
MKNHNYFKIKKLNQKGFGAMEFLLIFVVLGLIIGVTLYVINAKKDTENSLQSTNSTNSQTDENESTKTTQAPNSKESINDQKTDTATINYLTIKEWGVKAENKSDLTLSYKISFDGKSASFTSSAVQDLTPRCDAQSGSGGSINRFIATDEIKGHKISDYIKDEGVVYKNIGQYYYIFEHSQALCGSDPAKSSPLEQATNDAVKTLVQNLKSI